MVHSGVL